MIYKVFHFFVNVIIYYLIIYYIMDYKHLYLKYKNKYISLKSQIGGKIFWRYIKLTEEDFVTLYEKDTNHNDKHYSLKFLLTQQSSIPINLNAEPFNVLVGCTNSVDNDYYRFKNSNFYSLYIDSNHDTGFDSIKQYHMYTILYDDLIDQIKNIPQNIVLNIHFDTGVSYSCPGDEYLKIASHILVPGGKLIFNYGMQHAANIYFYDHINNKFSNNIKKEDLEQMYNIQINIDSNTIINYYNKNKLDPQFNVEIIYIYGNRRFINEFECNYIDYLREKYPKFTFEEKTYTFRNYTYPVPIRKLIDNDKINTYYEKINFIFNEIMNKEERLNYIKSPVISPELVHKLKIRILEEEEEKLQKFYDIFNILSFDRISKDKILKNDTVDTIRYNINLTLMPKFKYIEATKI